MKIAIIGAGLTGATIARLLADKGHKIDVYEKQHAPGGQAMDFTLNGTLVSQFGPHIFHTDDEEVWEFINQFGTFRPYRHKVQAMTKKGWFPWPINLETIVRVCGSRKSWKKEIEAGGCLDPEQRDKYHLDSRKNFETEAIKAIGLRLYILLIKYYTKKQWGVKPSLVPSEVFDRIPIKSDSGKNKFFEDKYVALANEGFTAITENMLNHDNIKVWYRMELGRKHVSKLSREYDFVISTAPPDMLLNYRHSALPYRKVSFIFLDCETDWPTPIANFCIKDIPFTRGTDYSRMYGGDKPITVMELPGQTGEKLYPIRTKHNIEAANVYINELKNHYGVISLGRLGSFQYLNMDTAIRKAMDFVKVDFKAMVRQKKQTNKQ